MKEQFINLDPKETKIPDSSAELVAAELPGGSAKNAILITDEQVKALQEAWKISNAKKIPPQSRTDEERAFAEREVEPDKLLLEAAKAILEAERARFPDAVPLEYPVLLWVRTEAPQRDPYREVDYNTWEVYVGGRRYADETDAKYFTHPDGTIEEVDRIEPLRGVGIW